MNDPGARHATHPSQIRLSSLASRLAVLGASIAAAFASPAAIAQTSTNPEKSPRIIRVNLKVSRSDGQPAPFANLTTLRFTGYGGLVPPVRIATLRANHEGKIIGSISLYRGTRVLQITDLAGFEGAAIPIDLDARLIRQDVTLKPLAKVTGRCTMTPLIERGDLQGSISLDNPSSQILRWLPDPKTRSFEIWLPPGNYRLFASCFDGKIDSLPFAVEAGARKLDLGLIPLNLGTTARHYGNCAPPINSDRVRLAEREQSAGPRPAGHWTVVIFLDFTRPWTRSAVLEGALRLAKQVQDYSDNTRFVLIPRISPCSFDAVDAELAERYPDRWRDMRKWLTVALDCQGLTWTAWDPWGSAQGRQNSYLIDPAGNLVDCGHEFAAFNLLIRLQTDAATAAVASRIPQSAKAPPARESIRRRLFNRWQ